MNHNIFILIAVLSGFLLGFLLQTPSPPIKPKIKLCTIKLNDVNNSKSYITGECVQ